MNRIRALFLSDVHLGSRACQAERLLSFLKQYECRTIFLLGDIVDFWALKRAVYWPEAHNTVVQKLLRLARHGVDIVYIPGNHDEALKKYFDTSFGNVRLKKDYVHVAADGKRGLYTQSLFRYGLRLLQTLNPAIELGRSFVRSEYQKNFSPLLLLWRGIGQFIVHAPQYAVLFGPVSISNNYAPVSRQLMVEYLRANRIEAKLARHVKPRRPFRVERSKVRNEVEVAELRDIEDLSRVIAQIEHDNKGIPILLKQYLKLGGRLLGFSSDDQFSDALDGLIVVDLRASEPRVLARYLGETGAATFFAHHASAPDLRRVS